MSYEKARKQHSSSSWVSTPRPTRPSTTTRPYTVTSDIKTLEEEEESNEYNLFTLPSVSKSSLYTTIPVDGQLLRLEIDTGVSFSIISKKTYLEKFFTKPLQSSPVKLKTYTGESLPVFGSINVEVKYEKRKMSLSLLVAGLDGPSLLGRDWLSDLRLDWYSILKIQTNSLDQLLQKYSDVFEEGLGTLKNFKAKLYVAKDVKPRFIKARSVPYAIRSLVDTEIDHLIAQNFIEPIVFSNWDAPIVPVLKSDGSSIRICGDFRLTVNPVSSLDHYPIPKVDDLFATLSGGKVFTKLDLRQAYQQLALDEDSKKYVVINTHRGLFRYNRLPFGVSSAQGIFQ